MRIALLTPAFNLTQKEASTITLVSLAQELAKRGHLVFIISNREKNMPQVEFLEDGVKIFRPYKFLNLKPKMGVNPLFVLDLILAHAFGVRRVEKEERIEFDIIHSFSASSLLMLRSVLAKKMSKRKKAILYHSFKSISQYPLSNLLLKVFSKYFKGIIVQSSYQKNIVVDNGVPEEKIEIISSHIDTSKFIPLDKEKVKKNLNLENKFIITYYGHFLKVKGVEYLLHACKELSKKTKNYLCLLIWSGLGDFDEYNNLIISLGLSDFVKVMHHSIPIVEYLNASNLVVLPYPSLEATEANPSCILESMACRVPVLTSRIPELQSFLHENINVFMAKPKNPEDIAKKIGDIMEGTQNIELLIKNAYDLSKNYTVKNAAARHEKLYRNK